MSFCKVMMNGRLCGDPELKQTPSGVYVTSFRLAISKGANDARFFSVVAWRSTAEFVVKHFRKGDGICLSGELDYRVYEKDGKKQTVYEIVFDSVGFPDGRVTRDNGQEWGGERNTPYEPNFAFVDEEGLPF